MRRCAIARCCTSHATLLRSSAAIALPSMMRATIACSCASIRLDLALPGLIDHPLHGGRERSSIAVYLQALDARLRAGHEIDPPQAHSEHIGTEPEQCRIRRALGRRDADPGAQHTPPVGELLGAIDRIAPALRREADVDQQALRIGDPGTPAHPKIRTQWDKCNG